MPDTQATDTDPRTALSSLLSRTPLQHPGRRRLAATLGLAAAAVLGNVLSVSLYFGVEILFGSIAALIAIARLGPVPGLVVAMAGGAYTLVLWQHPFALVIFTLEAAAIAGHRWYCQRQGLRAPPLAVSAALYWLLLGMPLVLLFYLGPLGMDWSQTLLVAVKQALNGILNAALAGSLLVAMRLLPGQPALPRLDELLFNLLLTAVLLPALLVTALENRGLKDHLEQHLAEELRLFGVLATGSLARAAAQGLDQLAEEWERLHELAPRYLPLGAAPRLFLADRATGAPPQAAAPAPAPDLVTRTDAPELVVVMPAAPTSSAMVRWRAARYRATLPAAGLAADRSLIIEVGTGPIIDAIHAKVGKLLAALLALAMAAVLLAHVLSRRIVAPLRSVAEIARVLPAAIRTQRAAPVAAGGLFAESVELGEAVSAMGDSLRESFAVLASERDEQVRQRARLREAQAIAHVGSWEWDIVTDTVTWSEETYRVLGYAPGSVQPSLACVMAVVHPNDRARLRAAITAARQHPGDDHDIELRVRGRAGAEVILRAQGRVHCDADGRPVRCAGTVLDVTSQRRMEATLRAEQERCRLVVENLEDLLVRVDVEGRFEFVSPSYCRTFGMTEAELLGRPFMPLVHPDDRAATAAAVARLFEPPHAVTVEQRARTARGWRWLQWSDRAVLDAAGAVVGIVALGRDITELKQTQQRLRAMFDSAPIGIALVGTDRRPILVNRALEGLLGRRASELTRLRFEEFTHPDDRETDVRLFAELTRGERDLYRLTKRYLTPDGAVVFGDLRVSLLPPMEGEPAMPLAMVEDVTELHLAHQQRRSLEHTLAVYASRLEELLDLVNPALPHAAQVQGLLDLACRALDMDTARLGLVDDGGLRFEPLASSEATPPAAPMPEPALLDRAMAQPGQPVICRVDALAGDAGTAGRGCRVALAFDGTGLPEDARERLLLVLYARRNVSLSDPLRQLLRLLAQRIAAVRGQERMQRHLVAAKERETIGHLASGVSHDFNNLLGVIDANLLYLEGCLETQASADPELPQVLEEMRSAMSQAKVVTSGILALSRAGGVPLAAVRLDTAVAELRAILRQVLPPAIALETDIPPGLEGWSNSAFLQAALLNLALNARDAMPGGGRLSIAAHARRWDADAGLAIGSLPAGPCTEITVADSGSGIPPAILSRIFEPLFSTKARRRGHGLGLFMVKEFVLRSGAGLLLETAPGRGTRFRLLMPTPPAPAADEEARGAQDIADGASSAAPSLAGLRLLVVDDDPRVREAVARLLAREGVETMLAGHGLAALELLRDDPRFDLVLSDVAMPLLDGQTLRERLRAEYPGLAVLLMTGQDTRPASDRTDTAARHVLRKPLDPAALRAAVRALCRPC